MNRFSIKFLIILGIPILFSCDDIFEKDIEKDKIVILSPADSSVYETFAVTFWWEEIEGTSGYRVQVVSPSFHNVSYFALDTLIEGTNKITHTFEPGSYQWRVRGENSAYVTDFSLFSSFSISSDSELSKQKVILSNPKDEILTNDLTLTFNWQNIPTADRYLLSIFADNYELDTVVNKNSVEIEFEILDREYNWHVVARKGEVEESKPSETWQFAVDVTAPSAPELITSDDAVFSSEEFITLEWSSPADDMKYDSLFIYDEDKKLIVDFAKLTEARRFSYPGDEFSIASYFWSVRSFDHAGNASVMSDTSTFRVE